MVKFLIMEGADVNACDEDGEYVLFDSIVVSLLVLTYFG
jgi:hypothetical protein